jgi:hypothetical protein
MPNTPEAVVTRLQALAATVTGIRNAPSTLPDQIAMFPAAISYLESFEESAGLVGSDNVIYTAVTELHVARKDLPRDYAVLDGMAALFITAVRNDSRSNTAGTLGIIASAIGNASGTLAASSWAAQDTLAWNIRVPFKIQQ